MTFQVTKTYGFDLGISACFRQHFAKSHCSFLHGYALSFSMTFEADELNAQNWVIDFGGFKSIKEVIQNLFDHKLLVAEDDPHKDTICALAQDGIADVVVLPATGCEAFAGYVALHVIDWLRDNGEAPRVHLAHLTVAEHGANAATWFPGDL
jgi:6-pyruvoyltetrahydropterin/6-carboxytetrahydropterin synthase